MAKTARGYKQSKTYKAIKKDLLDQLDRNHTQGVYYTNMVDTYMNLWVREQLLNDDIEENGVMVKWNNGGGQCGAKKNDSVDMSNKVNNQMLKILSELGIDPSQASEDVDEEM
jgi:Phage terminase, small subunit.